MSPLEAKEKALEIIKAISDGMSEPDAVTLADMSWEKYLEMKKKYPGVTLIIDKSKIEYKRKIIAKINTLALAGDVKAIQWVAENGEIFREDFGKKKNPTTTNPLSEALKFIQENSISPVRKIQTNA